MRGLKRLHENIGFTNFWDTAHSKPTPKYRSDADREDWEFYQTLRSDAKNYTRGNSCFAFGKDENGVPGGDNIEILSPTPALVKSCNQSEKSNDLSLVLRVRHKNWSVLLPGDAEAEAWDDMKNHYGAGLKSDYFKASHHGRDSGYHLGALNLIAPRVTFVSVGRKPDTDASSKYRQQCNKVASTRYHGNMELRFNDDGTHQWIVERNWDT
jgi:competence protein ComEC